MNEMALRRRTVVLLVTAFLSVMGGFAATAVMADDADAGIRRGFGGGTS